MKSSKNIFFRKRREKVIGSSSSNRVIWKPCKKGFWVYIDFEIEMIEI